MAMYTDGAYVEILARMIHDYLESHPEHGLVVTRVEMDMHDLSQERGITLSGAHRDTECRGQVIVPCDEDNDLLPDIPLLIKRLEEDIARNLLGITL